MTGFNYSRRRFLKQSALGTGASLLATSAFSIPALYACAKPDEEKLGIALVGLGNYSTNHLAPALQETEFCKLAGIVTGSPEKIPVWQKKYDIPDGNVYNYDNFDTIADNPDIDVVYVVLPNAMHAEYTIRAANAGKHVICEKPMAISVKECKDMIAACKKNNRKLQIGYRCQYEPHNRKLMELGQEKPLGPITMINTNNAFYARDEWDNWRFGQKLSGGGPLMDMGIYSVQGVRYTLGEEPVSVTAQASKIRPEKFKDVEETLLWQMQFDSGIIANCMTSYSARAGNIEAFCKDGNFGLEPAFGYGPLKGHIKGEPMGLPHTNHQSVQMDAFARNIMDDTEVIASGEEGLQDMRIIEAIYEAMRTGEQVAVAKS